MWNKLAIESDREENQDEQIQNQSEGIKKQPQIYKCKNQITSLTILLQDIFRKKKFRAGQLRILDRALQRKSVVGLLPTGGGKSLCYQLQALLQPGLTLVVDPLKSLMQDQIRGLKQNGLDCCQEISSNITAKDRIRIQNELTQGHYLLCMIAPERFLIQEFRDMLQELPSKKVYITSCVIDEVHCVSEWGHDFRIPYLRLGRLARRFCTSWSGDIIPIVGLTATASYDVLSDVQRELKLNEDDIIPYRKVDRKELKYSVIPIRIKQLNKNDNTKKILSENKTHAIYDNIKNLKEKNNHNKICGVVFNPHKSTKSFFSAPYIANLLREKNKEDTIDCFYSSENSQESKEMTEVQNKFLRGDLQLICSTKAFGMGIDKPDIRYIFHFNHPGSIESYYQEAGRAGRDGKNAFCYILYSGHDEERDVHRYFHSLSFPGIDKEIQQTIPLLYGYYDPKAKKTVEGIYNLLRNSENGEKAYMQVYYTHSKKGEYTYRVDKKHCYGKDILFKSIYRLEILGLVEDWTVDYNKKIITLKIIRLDPDQTFKNIKNYMDLYISKIKVDKKLRPLISGERKFNSENILHTLITFVYDEIFSKRTKSEEAMVEACHVGLTQGSDAFREILNLYFTSKYFKPLRDDLHEGKESRVNVVGNYLNECNGIVDNFKHLRGACTRLLIEHPKNGTILVLLGLSRMILEIPTIEIMNNALKQLSEGLEILAKENSLPMYDTWIEAEKMLEEIHNNNGRMQEALSIFRGSLRLNLIKEKVSQFNAELYGNME